MKNKKQITLMVSVFLFGLIISFLSCEEADKEQAKLTISNQSGRVLQYTTWNGTRFNSENSSYNLYYGDKAKNDVEPGTAYIYFTVGYEKVRTQDLITLKKDEEKIFYIYDSTRVIKTTNNESCTLSEL